MKKRIVFFLTFIIALSCILFAPAAAMAAGAPAYSYSSLYDSSYRYFDSYDVNVKVQENNVLDVTETIVSDYSVLYTKETHGIIRDIPKEFYFTLPDGSTKRFQAVVRDIQVPGQKFTTSSYTAYNSGSESDVTYCELKIGNPDVFVSGKVTYVIKYKYDIGDDSYDKADFLYYNIIGTEWESDIKNATFTVEMPKAFDAKNAVAYSGQYGSKTPVKLNISGDTISGSISSLGINQGIALLVNLPEGYFTGERVGPPYMYILLGIFAGISVLAVVLYLIFGRDEKVVQTVEFNAPEGLTPAEVGYIIDGVVDNKDVTSLIIYWADKGYLKLTEEKDKDILITKLKDLPANAKPFEFTMFTALFLKGNSVSVSSLKNTFYTTMESMKTQVKDSFDSRRIFTKISMQLQGFLGFLTAVPIIICFIMLMLENTSEFSRGSLYLCIFVIFLILGRVYSLITLIRSWRSLEHRKRIGKLVFSLFMLCLVFAGFILIMVYSQESLPLAVAAVAATMITAVCAMFIRRRTKLGTELLGKILGFQNFIEKAEKERIEKLVEENPNYFYSVLPYAYVLGVTDKWADNFEKIGIQPPPPPWYFGYGMNNLFTMMVFMNMFNTSMNSMNTSFVSRPAPKGGGPRGFGGGGFGGGFGGFSGGGFGGGGGRGW